MLPVTSSFKKFYVNLFLYSPVLLLCFSSCFIFNHSLWLTTAIQSKDLLFLFPTPSLFLCKKYVLSYSNSWGSGFYSVGRREMSFTAELIQTDVLLRAGCSLWSTGLFVLHLEKNDAIWADSKPQ